MRRAILVGAVVVTLAVPGLAHAAAGDLDTSFSGDGKVVSPIGAVDGARSVAVDSQGRIVVAGDDGAKVVLARYLPNGRLDRAFSGDGRLTESFGGSPQSRFPSVAVDSHDRVIVACGSLAADGHETFAIARYRPNGERDSSFSGNGLVRTSFEDDYGDAARAVAIDGSDRIVAVGVAMTHHYHYYRFALARYTVDGTLDSSFSGDGKQTTSFGVDHVNATSVAIDSAGRIVAAGSSSGGQLARYLPNGNLDPSFSGDGRVTWPSGRYVNVESVAISGGNRPVITGQADGGSLVARYRTDGTLDPSFSGNGWVTTDLGDNPFGRGVAVDAQNRIVTANTVYTTEGARFMIARYRPSGTLDPAFSGDGIVSTIFGPKGQGAGAIAIYPQGRIVAAGYADERTGGTLGHFALARYLG